MDTSAQPKPGLEWTRSEVRGGAIVRLRGVIDETFDRKALVAGLSGTVVFDFDGVTRITSFGIREWVASLHELKAHEIVFIRARPPIVTQFNTVADFGGTGALVTFYAPYICEGCDETVDRPVDLRAELEWVKQRQPPEVECPKCKEPCVFDDEPSLFFEYFVNREAPQLSPVGAALVDGTEVPPPSLRIEKEVVEQVTGFWLSGSLESVGQLKRLLDGVEGEVAVIFHQVEDVGPATAGALSEALSALAGPVHLARVPLPLIEAKLDHQLSSNLHIVSVSLICVCPTCGKRALHEFASPKTLLSQGKHPCLVDGTVMSPELPLEDRQRILKAMSSAPASIARYLVEHPLPPRALDEKSPHAGVNPAAGPDEHLFGRYELTRPLGRGGMAEVFLARQLSLGGFSKTVVLKRILPHLGNDQAFVEMFLQEARLAARINHPNVVEIFDVGQVGNRYFIAMEYVRGVDLARLLQAATALGERMPLQLAARVVADVAAGLHAAHTSAVGGVVAPIIHRDVSPHNILLAHDGRVKLTDFGIAKAADGAQLTPSNTVKGKTTYLAPEQIRSSIGAADARVDIFPLGLTLYQCVTLQHMFRRDTDYATMWALLIDPVKRLSQALPGIPPLADDVLAKCLARDPNQRYRTAQEAQVDLERIIAAVGKDASYEALAQWIRFIDDQAKVKNLSQSVLEPTPSTGSTTAEQATRTVHQLKS